MANYSNDHDLVKIRPDILKYNVTDWEAQHVKAKKIIDRVLEVRWYKNHSAEQGVDWTATPFDSAKVDVNFVKDLACYKALELIYLHLMSDNVEEDAFARTRQLFADMYEKELQDVLASGLGYDWDASGKIEADERLQPEIARLQRM
jgi:hypothetical protein